MNCTTNAADHVSNIARPADWSTPVAKFGAASIVSMRQVTATVYHDGDALRVQVYNHRGQVCAERFAATLVECEAHWSRVLLAA